MAADKNAPQSAEIAARIIRMRVAPFLHQGFELGVVAVGQHDPRGDEEITGRASRLRQPLALQAKNPPARGVLGYRQFDRATKRRHPNLAAEHGLIKRDGKIDAQIAAIELEKGVWRNVDRNEEIARPMSGRGLALPFQPNLLASGDTGGHLGLELLCARPAGTVFPPLY